ncbi:MAG: M48 family metallopeptidase [Lysobacterales bacterium]
MSALNGYYFDGRSAQRQPAKLTLHGAEVHLDDGEKTHTFNVADLLVTPRTGSPSRFIALGNTGQFQCDDCTELDYLPQQSSSDGLIAWLEQRWIVALACVALIAVMLFAGHRYGLPAAAENIAQRIPIESEKDLGAEVLSSLEQYAWLSGSYLPEKQRAHLTRRFNQFRKGMAYEAHLNLQFRHTTVFDANAFALPGGTIVVTDQLVDMAESDDEVLAILAHEIGHIERRHTMRSLIQNSLVAVAATAITADAASLTAAVAGLPVVLVQSEYSREFETEADTFAFALLREHDISPSAFADMMERMQARYPESSDTALNFLSSHPLMEQRIRQARAAALGEDRVDADRP